MPEKNCVDPLYFLCQQKIFSPSPSAIYFLIYKIKKKLGKRYFKQLIEIID